MDIHELTEKFKSTLSYKCVSCTPNTVYAIPYGYDSYMWVVDEGILINERNSRDGALIGTGIYASDMILGISSLDNKSGMIMCRPLQHSVLLQYSTKDIMNLLSMDVEATNCVLRFACSRFYFMLHTLEFNTLHSVDERVGELEKILSSVNQNVPDTVLAEYLGICPASIGRARKNRMLKSKKHSPET